jgi:FtsZ-interacting cell division protein ZipA
LTYTIPISLKVIIKIIREGYWTKRQRKAKLKVKAWNKDSDEALTRDTFLENIFLKNRKHTISSGKNQSLSLTGGYTAR